MEVNFPCTNHPCDHPLQNTSRGASSLAPQWWLKASTAVKPIQYVHLHFIPASSLGDGQPQKTQFLCLVPSCPAIFTSLLYHKRMEKERRCSRNQFLQAQPVSMQHSGVWPDLFASQSARTCIKCLSAKLGRQEHESNRPCIIQAPSSMWSYKEIKETRSQR